MLTLENYETPEALQKLWAFNNELGDFYADLEFLKASDDRITDLWPNNHKDFVVFAMDGSGSLLAFWFYESGLTIETAPLVFLDSEGGANVMASSVNEFLSLLAYDTHIFSAVAEMGCGFS